MSLNALTRLLNIKYPIIQGGMGNISNAILTVAICEAGGLGTIGAGTMTPAEIEKIIIETKKRTNHPFAINIALTISPYVEEILQLIIKHHVPIVSLSAGNPAPYISLLHERQIKVITVVASVRQAIKAEAAHADVIVAEGYEAAGVNSKYESTTLVLIPQIVQSVRIPVVAAGGIGDGSGLAAMLALGASGVQMGTRFIATKEAPFHEEYKKQIIEGNDHCTAIIGRSVGKIRRVIRTEYAEELLNSEKNGITLEEFALLTSEKVHLIGALEGNGKAGFMNSGQIAGLIHDLPSVEELLTNMMNDAKFQLNQAVRQF